MASDEQRPVDPRVSAYAKVMGSKPSTEKRAVPFNPPRLSSAKTENEPVPAKAKPEVPEKPRRPPVNSASPVSAPPKVDAASVPLDGFIKTTGGPADREADRSADGGFGGENNYRKVAKFLVLIGKEEAARILSKLDPAQVERVSRELATITRIETAEAEALLEEFKSLLGGSTGAFNRGEGGLDAARDLLRTAFGKAKGDAFLKRAVPESAENPFAFLEDFEGEQIALLLKEEAAPAVALILSRMEPKTAAAVLGRLEPAIRLETIKRLAKLGKVSPEVIERTAAALREKARSIGRETTKVVDGRSALAEILKLADATLGDRLLEELAEADPELGRDIKERLFTLDDIIKVEDRAVQEKLRTLSDKDIALLLKGRRPSFVEKILSNVTVARRAIIAEERSIIGPVPRSEADEAARQFLAYFRQGREEGRIVLIDDADL
ncbi:MAG: FliG C-terminal domain-containing protein, partial [Treponemataceae bacterium]